MSASSSIAAIRFSLLRERRGQGALRWSTFSDYVCLVVWPTGQPQVQSFQQQPAAQQPAQPSGQPAVSFHPEIQIDQNNKQLQLTGGTFSFAGKEISLPSIPVAFPAIPALNTLSAVYPSAFPLNYWTLALCLGALMRT